MRLDGEWLQCDDGIVRPVIRAEIEAGDGNWRAFELLIDTGADRTVISANVLASLSIATTASPDRIGGVGGQIDTVIVSTRIRLMSDDGRRVAFRSNYAACTQLAALDMSVLGRDILEMFTLIVDRQSDVVALLGGTHGYTVTANQPEA